MKHESALFNFSNVIAQIQEKWKGDKNIQSVLDTITENTELEDLPLFKDYLCKFDLEHDLKDIELKIPSKLAEYKADFFLLSRFILSSFSNTYKLNYDKDTNSVELLILMDYKGKPIIAPLQNLRDSQVSNLFKIYLQEAINNESGLHHSMKEKIKEFQELKLIQYQKQIRQLWGQVGSGEILDDLDALLNS